MSYTYGDIVITDDCKQAVMRFNISKSKNVYIVYTLDFEIDNHELRFVKWKITLYNDSKTVGEYTDVDWMLDTLRNIVKEKNIRIKHIITDNCLYLTAKTEYINKVCKKHYKQVLFEEKCKSFKKDLVKLLDTYNMSLYGDGGDETHIISVCDNKDNEISDILLTVEDSGIVTL